MLRSHSFLNVMQHGFVRVAVVIPTVHVANPKKNAEAHIEKLDAVYRAGAAYALCPELGLTGYSVQDLFFNRTLLSSALDALNRIVAKSTTWGNMIVAVGLPLVHDQGVYNVIALVQNGKVLAFVPKSYLPNYREFEEARWFKAARFLRGKCARLFGHDVPIGTDIMLRGSNLPEFVLHHEVCEDGWMAVPPSSQAALNDATVLCNASASNITIGKANYRRNMLVLPSSARCNAAQLYSAAGFGESTTNVSWDGDGYIAERGSLLANTKRFQRQGEYIIADIDLLSIIQDRKVQTTWGENALDFKKDYRVIDVPVREEFGERAKVYDTLLRSFDPHPFVPSNPADLDERCRETFMIQAMALVQKLLSLPEHMRKVVIGISGGQDSTHAILVAAYAMDELGLPRSNIIGVTMPGFGTSNRTYRNACKLIREIGATFKKISIKTLATQTYKDTGVENVEQFMVDIKRIAAANDNNVTRDERKLKTYFENVQAWSRKHVLFSVSGFEGAMVLGTGDLSEMLVGWCTMFGDHASHYGVNAGVPKTLISFLIKWTADVIYVKEPKVQRVLLDILATEISPELLPLADDGTIAQKSQDSVGPYELVDFFGYYLVRWGYDPSRIARLALAAFGDKYDIFTIKKWLRLFLKRFFGSQFKRSCLPDGPKVGLLAICPRGDWRMPSDAEVEIWLEELERNIPDELPLAA